MAYYYVVRVLNDESSPVSKMPVYWEDSGESKTTNYNGVSYIAASNGDPDYTWVSLGGTELDPTTMQDNNGIFYDPDYSHFEVRKVTTTTNYTNVTVYPILAEGDTGVSTDDMTITYSATTGTRYISGNTGTVSVSSGNTSIATVSRSGSTITVTRKGYGTTTIYCDVPKNNGYAAASSTFTVICQKASISPSISGTSQAPLSHGSITYSLSGNSGSAQVTWSSSNTSVATVTGGNSNASVTLKALGTTTITAQVAESQNYYSGTATIELTVSKAQQSAPTVTSTTVEYATSGSISGSYSGGGGHGNLRYKADTSGGTNYGSDTVSAPSRYKSSIGTTTYVAYWTGDTNYEPSDYSNQGSLTVTKASQAAPTVTSNSATYATTGSISGSASGGGGKGTKYYLIDTSGGTNYGSPTTSAPSRSKSSIGTTTYVAYWSGNTYYDQSPYSSQGSLTVSKASQAAPTATGDSVSYPNTAYASASGGGGKGTLEWSNGSSRSAVGSQTTSARWSGNDYYDPSPWSNEVTLTVTDKSDQSAPTATGGSAAYPGTAYASASGGGGKGSLEWSNGSSYSGNAGTSITTKARWSGNSSYNPSPWSNEVTLSITKGSQSAPTAYDDTVEYGDTATAYASGGGGHGTLYYKSDTSGGTSYGSATTTAPSRSSIGTTTYVAYWGGDSNYNASSNSSQASLVVSKASQSAPTAYGDSVTYGSTATATYSGGGGYGSIEWYNGSTRSAVGSQTTKCRWTGNSYYAASDWSNTVTLSVSKADQSAPTASGATTTYPTTAYASASGGGGYGSLEWYNGSSRSAVGSQTTKARWSGNTNYNASPYSNEVTLQVNAPGAPTFYIFGDTVEYGSTATAEGYASVAGTIYWGTTSSSSGMTSSAHVSAGGYVDLYSRSSIGSTTVYGYFVPDDSNYPNVGSSSSAGDYGTVTVSKASQSAPTATGSTVAYGNTATATYTGGGGYGSIEWYNGSTRTAVGSQTTKCRWTGNTYYAASAWSNTVTLEVTKADQDAPTATGATVTYGNTATATATGGGGQGSLEWSNGSTRTAVGSQTTKARWSGNTNYNASPYSNEVTLKVNKAAGATGVSTSAMTITYSTTTATRTVSGNTGTVTVSSDDTSIATVSISGSTITVTRKGYGSCTITCVAASTDNYNEATSTFTVYCNKASISPSITCSNIVYGTSTTATVSGNTGSGSVTWSSSNTSIATVNSSGVVSGVGVGSVTITATIGESTNYWGGIASTTITVSKAVNTLTISPSSETIYNTSGYNTFTITPSGAQGGVSYSSSNTSVATVNQSGVVTYVSAGSATITVTAAGNSNYYSGSETCSVTCKVDTVIDYDYNPRSFSVYVSIGSGLTAAGGNANVIVDAFHMGYYLYESGKIEGPYDVEDSSSWSIVENGNSRFSKSGNKIYHSSMGVNKTTDTVTIEAVNESRPSIKDTATESITNSFTIVLEIDSNPIPYQGHAYATVIAIYESMEEEDVTADATITSNPGNIVTIGTIANGDDWG